MYIKARTRPMSTLQSEVAAALAMTASGLPDCGQLTKEYSNELSLEHDHEEDR